MRRKSTGGSLVFATAILCCCLNSNAQAAAVRIADTSTPIPFGVGNFSEFNPPSISGSTVVFLATGLDGEFQSGFYTGSARDGTLFRIADMQTTIPGTGGHFRTFHNYTMASISGSTVAFTGQGSRPGVYVGPTDGSSLSLVADLHSTFPGLTGTAFGAAYAVISGSTIAFRARNDDRTYIGAYTAQLDGSQPFTLLADLNSLVPNGTGTFSDVGLYFAVSDSTVTFYGRDGSGQFGIYASPISGGPISCIVDSSTAVPDGIGNFTVVSEQSISGSNVAFHGTGSDGQDGLYVKSLNLDGSTVRIVDLNTPIPMGVGNFVDFANQGFPVSLSDSTVAFIGRGTASQIGIYAGSVDGAPLSKVIAAGDTLDGRIVDSLRFNGNKGLDRGLLAFSATFTDGTGGVYVTTLPELELAGDTNVDGVVDLADLNNVRNHFGASGLGDTNSDGIVDLVDLNNVRNHFGDASGANPVPEPAASGLALIGAASAGCFARRRRAAAGR